ncbi:MAG: hypothetical protein ACXW1T_12295 [Methylophilus sp.]
MSSPLDQEFRSRELADSLRKYLIGINTGGIAVVTALSKSLSWAPTIMFFILGIVFCGISLFFAQYRTLKRRDSAKLKMAEPIFPLYRHSRFWNALSFLCFVVGAILGLICYQA